MLRRAAESVVIAVVALVAMPAAISQAHPTVSAAPAASVKTSVVHLSPVTKSGKLKPGYAVTKTFSFASCEAGSEATGNGYRCFAGKSNHALNRVIDPCWVEGDKRFVVCLKAPWSFNVTELTVTKGYDNAGRRKKHAKLPWGVQLTNGVQCIFEQGAGTSISGKRLNYSCENSPVVLYGNVDKGHPSWSIRQATAHGGHFKKNGRAKLSTAWFGKASRKG